MQTRIVELDSLKGLAIIGVVIAHSAFRARLGENVISLVEQLQLIFGWCVIAFFFSSGYLAKPIENTSASIIQFVKHRAKRLLVPSIVFSITYKLIFLFLSQTGYFSWEIQFPGSPYEMVLFIFQPVGPQFYFLNYLFCISIGVTLLLSWTTIGFLQIFGAFLFTGSYFLFDAPISGYGPDMALLPIYTAAYMIGLLISRYPLSRKCSAYYFIWIAVVLVLSAFEKSFVFVYLLVPPTIMFLFKKWENLNRAMRSLRLGEYSSGIYVWHAPLLMPFLSIVMNTFIQNGYIQFFGTLLTTIVACYVLQRATNSFVILKPWQF